MIKKITLQIIIGAIIAIFLNRLYYSYAEPSNLFFSECYKKSTQWEKSIRQKNKNCFILAGGSEVRMGIDPQIMWDSHKVAAINTGIQAGNGVRCNIQAALPYLRAGDTLVLSCIPNNTILGNNATSQSGINFCYNKYGNAIFTDGIIPFNKYSISTLITGNTRTLCIHAMRLLTRPNCIYRYSSPKNAQITNSGRVEVYLNTEQNFKQLKPHNFQKLNFSDWNHLIEDVKKYCSERNIQFVMYLSRSHNHATARHLYAQGALHFTRLGIPVLKDYYLGAWDNESKFSDTGLHLSIEGGKEFSEFLANQLKMKSYWSEEELIKIINETK